MYLATASSDRWSLSVDGQSAPRSKAFGWANSFEVPASGNGSLGFSTPVSRYGLLAIQIAMWAAAIWALRFWRRQDRMLVAAPAAEVDA